jgi:hypothetical protein
LISGALLGEVGWLLVSHSALLSTSQRREEFLSLSLYSQYTLSFFFFFPRLNTTSSSSPSPSPSSSSMSLTLVRTSRN